MAENVFRSKKVRLNLIALAAFITLMTATPATAQTLVLTNGEWPPLFSEHLPHGGVGSRMITEAFAQSDILVEYDYAPWKRALDLAAHDDHHGSVGWRKTKKRQRYFLFSKPLFTVDTVFFYNKSRPFDWARIEDVGHLKIGATLGYTYIDQLRSITRQHAGKLELAPSDEVNLRKLISGRIDVFPRSKSVGCFILNTQIGFPSAKTITYHPQPLRSGPIYLLISKNVPNAQTLIEQFNTGLLKLKESGRYDHIMHDCMKDLEKLSPTKIRQ